MFVFVCIFLSLKSSHVSHSFHFSSGKKTQPGKKKQLFHSFIRYSSQTLKNELVRGNKKIRYLCITPTLYLLSKRRIIWFAITSLVIRYYSAIPQFWMIESKSRIRIIYSEWQNWNYETESLILNTRIQITNPKL